METGDNDPTFSSLPWQVQPSSHPVQSLPVRAREHRRDRRLPSLPKRRLWEEDRVRWTRAADQRGGHWFPPPLSADAFLPGEAACCDPRPEADQPEGAAASARRRSPRRRRLPTFLRGSSACKTEGASSCQRPRSQLASAKAAKGSDGPAAECGQVGDRRREIRLLLLRRCWRQCLGLQLQPRLSSNLS